MIFILLLLFIPMNLLSQELAFEEKIPISDSIIEKTEYYLLAKSDSIYRMKVYHNDVLYLTSYTDTFLGTFAMFGTTQFYYSSGNLRSTGIYKYEAQGEWMVFFENGNLQSIFNWHNGVLKGKSRDYYEHGNLKSEGRYEYYEEPLYNVHYSSKVGEWKFYYPNGKIKEEQHYWDGKPIKRPVIDPEQYRIDEHTLSNEYFEKIEKLPDGSLDESKYKRNVKDGKWLYWSEEGKLIKVENYDKDKLLKTEKF